MPMPEAPDIFDMCGVINDEMHQATSLIKSGHPFFSATRVGVTTATWLLSGLGFQLYLLAGGIV